MLDGRISIANYHKVQEQLQDLEELKWAWDDYDNEDPKSKKPARRYSSMAHLQLISQEQKLLSDMMRYGYARVPEALSLSVDEDDLKGFSITLTTTKASEEEPQINQNQSQGISDNIDID